MFVFAANQSLLTMSSSAAGSADVVDEGAADKCDQIVGLILKIYPSERVALTEYGAKEFS